MRYILLISLLLITVNINAHEKPKLNLTNNYITNSVNNSGIALSMSAAAIDCTMSTQRIQVGTGLGVYNDSTALTIGACKRFNNVLLKLSGGKDGNNTAYNASVMFTLD